MGTSLWVHWLRTYLQIQGMWVLFLVWEKPACFTVTKPMLHIYWAHVLQLLKPTHLEPMLCKTRSQHTENSIHRHKEEHPLTATRERLA